MKKYIVRLSKDEGSRLKRFVSSGKIPARTFTRAHVLSKADIGKHGPAWPDNKISEAFEVTVQTVERIRRQLVEEGLDAVLSRHKFIQKVSRRTIDGDVEVHLVALACSSSGRSGSLWCEPDGSSEWQAWQAL